MQIRERRTSPNDPRVAHDEREASCACRFVDLIVPGRDSEIMLEHVLMLRTEGQVELVRREELREGVRSRQPERHKRLVLTAEKGYMVSQSLFQSSMTTEVGVMPGTLNSLAMSDARLWNPGALSDAATCRCCSALVICDDNGQRWRRGMQRIVSRFPCG